MNYEVVTRDADSNEQLVYFTSSSLDAADKILFYISYKGGVPNLYAQDLASGETTQLSNNQIGPLKSYVYFRGLPYQGFGKASVSINAERALAYWIEGRNVYCSDAYGGKRVVTVLPEGQMTAFTHVSADGNLICIPTTDERAMDDETNPPFAADGCGGLSFNIDERVQKENLMSTLHVYETKTGREVERICVDRAWITHVQFSPADPRSILYNHEWPCFDCGTRRMWLYRDGTSIRLRQAGEGRKPEDWTCHEMWEPNRKRIVYHGGYKDGLSYIGLVRQDMSLTEIVLPKEYQAYGHFAMGNVHPEWLITDGYYTDKEGNHDYICMLKVDWETKQLLFQPLCRHMSPWTTQDTHPHPIFDHHDQYVYFTAMVKGKLKVCRTAVR